MQRCAHPQPNVGRLKQDQTVIEADIDLPCPQGLFLKLNQILPEDFNALADGGGICKFDHRDCGKECTLQIFDALSWHIHFIAVFR